MTREKKDGRALLLPLSLMLCVCACKCTVMKYTSNVQKIIYAIAYNDFECVLFHREWSTCFLGALLSVCCAEKMRLWTRKKKTTRRKHDECIIMYKYYELVQWPSYCALFRLTQVFFFTFYSRVCLSYFQLLSLSFSPSHQYRQRKYLHEICNTQSTSNRTRLLEMQNPSR